MDKIRAEFEAKFPTPHGVYWDEVTRRYKRNGDYAVMAKVAQQRAWDAWQAAIPDPCEWIQDEWDNSCDTSCGNKYEIIDGTPEHNGMNYCTYCGGKLETIAGDATRAETQGKHE